MAAPVGTHETEFVSVPSVRMMMTVGEAVGAYFATRRWQRGTMKVNEHTLRHFTSDTGDPPIADLDRHHVEAWWANQASMSPGTARGRHSTVSNFLRWCRHAGLLEGDPMVTIERPREPRRVPVTLTDGEVERLLKVVPDLRADVIVRLMLDIGLRCIDVHRLQVGDVDLDRLLVTIHGKGGHVDLLPLPTVTARSIRRYLDAEPVSSGPLVRAYGAPLRALSAQRMSELLAAWMRDAGIKRRRLDGRGAHALRRTCATQLLDDGANVRQVQAVLRHQSMATTSRYLRRADAEELRSILERA